jgi:DNA topoisomerase-1
MLAFGRALPAIRSRLGDDMARPGLPREKVLATVAFSFRGKSGKAHKVSLRDRRLAKIVRACQDIPGQELFQYYDEEGRPRDVTSQDVNAYLREIAGEEFTAKDFRTWAGTVLAAFALQEFESFDSKAAARRNITRAIEKVAGRLGNTPTICRKCYVHPEVFNAYLDGDLVESLKAQVEEDIEEHLHGLSPEEAAVLAFLQRRLAAEAGRRNAA